MRFGKFFAAAAAASLATAPAMAAPVNPAASLSLGQSARVGSTTDKKDDALEIGIIVAIIAGAAVIVGIVVIATDDNSSPDSP